MTIELQTTLAQAEVLFLSFDQLVADIDKRKAEEVNTLSRMHELRHRNSATSSTCTTPQKKQTEVGPMKLSDDLRKLLVSGV